jgi:teichuronic acid biosynthesis glycosyltransferase TuaG
MSKGVSKEYVSGRVSVITPVYNASKHLSRTIESVLKQTYKDIEIVLVDDCSTDDSAEIIKNFKSKHKNIVYYCQDKNRGAGAARNKALEIATGQYVAFLDSDDQWLPEKIAKQMKLMNSLNCPFSYTAIEMIDNDDNLIKGKRKIKTKCDYKYLLHNTIIATSSVVIDRNVLRDFRMPLRRGGQDYATWLMLLRSGVIAHGVDEVLVRYRVSNNSLSSNKFKSIKQVWEIQTKDEKINKFKVIVNIICFLFNAFKKYFFN